MGGDRNTEPGQEEHPVTSAGWQRLASRRAFQNDVPGAVEAMVQAVTVDPDNFHHWMWLGHLYQRLNDEENVRRTGRESLRCLRDAPNPAISPEERTRLVVRASLRAGEPDRACEAIDQLAALRRNQMGACRSADTFADWYQADLFAAPIFETLLELRLLLGEPGGVQSIAALYLVSLNRGLELAQEEDVDPEDVRVLEVRLNQVSGHVKDGLNSAGA